MPSHYDIIGDIHGQTDTFLRILKRLGYERSRGVFRAPSGRMLVSVGDVIDKGPDPLGSFEIMMQMVEAEQAHMVIGNHEINALHYQAGLRPRTAATTEQFQTTLKQINASPKRWDIISKFILKTPNRLELDSGALRIVHAHWPSDDLPSLISVENFEETGPQGPYFHELQKTVKGPIEESAPYVDKKGVKRTMDRIPWWQTYPSEAPFLAFGHYCFPWPHRPEIPSTPSLLGPGQNACCLDFGAGINDRLVALRYPEMEFIVEPVASKV